MKTIILYPVKKKIKIGRMLILLSILIITFLISISVGRYSISIKQFLHIIYSKIFSISDGSISSADSILFEVRLPRIIGAMLIGAALSISGAAYQGIFKNPMVSPDILGASSGAAFGSAIAILLSFNSLEVQLSSFVFGIIAVTLTYIINKFIGYKSSSTAVLILVGMVVSNFFSAFISLVKYSADADNKLPAITFWLLGGLTTISLDDIKIMLIVILIPIILLMLLRWRLNVLSFGDEEASALGINVHRTRAVVIICSTILTAVAVSFSGIIGWIGLIIPHISRMIAGPNHKHLLPTCLIIGSTFLLIVDDIARNIFVTEIPLGIITSLIGAPLFIYLIIRRKNLV